MHLLILIAEMALTAVVILGLYRLKPKFGLAPLFIFLGSNQYLQGVLAATLYVPVFGGYISPGSVVLFSGSIFATLLVYLREDLRETRALIYGIVFSNITLSVLSGVTAWQLRTTGALNALSLPVDLFELKPRLVLAGTGTLVVVAILLAAIYELLFLRVPSLPLSLRIILSLLSVQYVDALFFTTLSFWGTPTYPALLKSAFIGKTISSLVYGVILYAYVRERARDRVVRGATDSVPIHDVFSVMTQREQYELMQESAFRQAVMIKIGQSETSKELLSSVLRTIAKNGSWVYAEAWVHSPDSDFLVLQSSWHEQQGGGFGAFRERNREAKILPGDDLVGQAWIHDTPLWLEDVGADASPQCQAARHAGFRSVFGVPVDVGRERYAVMLFYAETTRREVRRFTDLVWSLVSKVGAAIERKRAEQALAQSELRYRGLFSRSRLGLVTLSGDGSIEAVNPAAESMFGRSEADMTGQPFSALLQDATGLDFLSMDVDANPTDERRARRGDGTTFPVEISLFSFHMPTGRKVGAQIVDISEKRAVEEMKKKFVATVSHELRTPLTSIRGALQLAASGVVGPVEGKARELLQVADRNSERLLRIINDILDFEKLGAGRLDLSLTPVPVGSIISRSVESVAAQASAAGVVVEREVEQAHVLADADRMVQVLVNLVSNAVKFSSAGGRIVIRAAHAGSGLVEFSVRDSGRGIPVDAQSRIFEPFHQAETTDGTQRGGTGLGLAISKGIVEQHGGEIGFTSAPGEGSNFWFRIPAADGPA